MQNTYKSYTIMFKLDTYTHTSSGIFDGAPVQVRSKHYAIVTKEDFDKNHDTSKSAFNESLILLYI